MDDIWRPSCTLNDEFWVTHESCFSCRTRCCTSWKTSLIWIKCVTARWRVWRTTCSSCSTDARNCCSLTRCGTWMGVTHHRCTWFPVPCWRHECSERHGQVFKYYTSQSQRSFRGEFTPNVGPKETVGVSSPAVCEINSLCLPSCQCHDVQSQWIHVNWTSRLSSGMLTVSGVASTSSSYSPGRFSMCHSSAFKRFKENSNNIY